MPFLYCDVWQCRPVSSTLYCVKNITKNIFLDTGLTAARFYVPDPFIIVPRSGLTGRHPLATKIPTAGHYFEIWGRKNWIYKIFDSVGDIFLMVWTELSILFNVCFVSHTWMWLLNLCSYLIYYFYASHRTQWLHHTEKFKNTPW